MKTQPQDQVQGGLQRQNQVSYHFVSCAVIATMQWGKKKKVSLKYTVKIIFASYCKGHYIAKTVKGFSDLIQQNKAVVIPLLPNYKSRRKKNFNWTSKDSP